MYQMFKDRGFMMITAITNNMEGGTPTVEDLQEWADTYGQTFPVVDGSAQYWNFGSGGLPTKVLIGRGMVIDSIGEWPEEAEIEALLEE